MKYRVAYATGSRADYGIVRHYLEKLNADSNIQLSILVTGSHLEDKYGNSVENIINTSKLPKDIKESITIEDSGLKGKLNFPENE